MGEKITEILPLRYDSPDPRTLFSSVAGEGEVSGMDFAAPRGGFMRSTLKARLLIVIISLSSSVAQAQNAGLTHIFPQVVDGVSSDGTVYTSRFLIATSGGSPATCLRCFSTRVALRTWCRQSSTKGPVRQRVFITGRSVVDRESLDEGITLIHCDHREDTQVEAALSRSPATEPVRVIRRRMCRPTSYPSWTGGVTAP
jgi:hypothetical protein